jgi:hypothetical protein
MCCRSNANGHEIQQWSVLTIIGRNPLIISSPFFSSILSPNIFSFYWCKIPRNTVDFFGGRSTMLVNEKKHPTPSKKAKETETRGAIVRHLHDAVDTLCGSSLATSATMVGKAELDMTVINRLLNHCAGEIAKSAAEECGDELDMNEANASIRNRIGDEWKVMLSRQSGKPFYHNEISGATLWERPDKLTAAGIGLELSPEAIASSNAIRNDFEDYDSFLVSVRKALSRLPEHNERVDIAGVVSRGLNTVADAVDNVVVSRANPSSAIPFTNEALKVIDACGKLVKQPEIAWLLQDPTSQLKAEASQLRSLLALATTSVGNTSDINFSEENFSTTISNHNKVTSSSSSSGGGGGSDATHPREISRICRHILASASEQTPSTLPDIQQRHEATRAALKRLDDLKAKVLYDSQVKKKTIIITRC